MPRLPRSASRLGFAPTRSEKPDHGSDYEDSGREKLLRSCLCLNDLFEPPRCVSGSILSLLLATRLVGESIPPQPILDLLEAKHPVLGCFPCSGRETLLQMGTVRFEQQKLTQQGQRSEEKAVADLAPVPAADSADFVLQESQRQRTKAEKAVGAYSIDRSNQMAATSTPRTVQLIVFCALGRR